MVDNSDKYDGLMVSGGSGVGRKFILKVMIDPYKHLSNQHQASCFSWFNPTDKLENQEVVSGDLCKREADAYGSNNCMVWPLNMVVKPSQGTFCFTGDFCSLS